MIRSYTPAQPQKMPVGVWLVILIGAILIGFWDTLFLEEQHHVYAASTSSGQLNIPYEEISSDLTVDWSGKGDFDPRGKCPDDFFAAGFIVVCKRLADGSSIKFLLHKGKQILYRLDKDVIGEKIKFGLHWVTGTRYNAKYRIADSAYKNGKTVLVPNAKGGMDQVKFQYGQAVSKKRVRPDRELFRETHIEPGQCRSWWDLFNFMP